jgi:membrane protein
MIFSEKFHKFKETLSTPVDELNHFSRFLVFQFRLWPLCLKLLRTNRADQQAAALAYHSIFGFIPLAIVMLVIFQSFPGSENMGVKVRDMIYDSIQLDKFQYPDPENPEETVMLTEYINNLVGGFFEKTGKGSMTILSLLFVCWAAIKLLVTIERTFNNMWNVSNGRGLLQRIFYYWTPLTLGPLLIGVGIYIKTLDIINQRLGGFIEILNGVSGWLIPIVVFFLLYWSMPNTKVRALPALWAAAVAAVLWVLLKELYGFYVVEYMPFRALYGILGLIPLTMLWIYISWLVVLFGVQLAYTSQNLEKLDAIETSSVDSAENYAIAGEDTIIAIICYISEEFDKGNAPVPGEKIVRKFSLPYKLVYHVLGKLVKSGVLVNAVEPKDGYSLAKSSDKIYLSQIKEIAVDHRIDGCKENCPTLKEAMEKYQQSLKEVTLSDINTANSDV